MTIAIKACAKCGGELKAGKFTGQKVEWEKEQEPVFLKQSGQAIITYACTKCGFLESYVKR